MEPQRIGNTNLKGLSRTRSVSTPAAHRQPPAPLWALWLVGAVVLAVIPAVIFMIVNSSGEAPTEPNVADNATPRSTQPLAEDGGEMASEMVSNATQPPAETESSTEESALIDDDGQTLWASPTHGQPLNLAYLPPGSQIIVALRPAALAEHPEGEKVFDSLGPIGSRGFQFLNDSLLTPAGCERVIIGCRVTSDGNWEAALMVQLTGGRTAAEHLAAELPNAIKKDYSGQIYWLDDQRAYYLPSGADSMLLVVASAEAITEIIDLGGSPPPLRRDVERLLAHTDADRHFTMVLAPGYLFSEGQDIFRGAMARLRDPLFWFLGDGLSAVSLSMSWDDNFFIELLALPTLDTPPDRAAKQLAGRVAQLPEWVEDYAVRLNAEPYGRRIVEQLPEMVRKLVAYTRSGVEDDLALLRCYLPAVAGHNLLMGAELMLAQPPGGPVLPAEASAPPEPVAIDELLKRPTSLRFTKETLEAALEQLGQDIGVEIVILGKDLQLEGITKNQSFGIDIQNQPAGDILVEILRRANPDKAATGPADMLQKLVYVIGTKEPGGPEVILVTTRAGAKERGEQFPTVFKVSK